MVGPLLFFFVHKELPLEEQKVKCSTSDATVGKVKYRTEEDDLLCCAYYREVEHIHYVPKHKWCVVPYNTVEQAINDISYRSCCNHRQTDQNARRSTFFDQG